MLHISRLFALIVVLSALACAPKPVKEEDPAPDRNWIEQIARDHNHEVLKCYEDSLNKNPKLSGDLTLSLDAGSTGEVTAVRVKKSVQPAFDQCVTAKAKTWKFPWIKKETFEIEDPYHLYLDKEGKPVAEFESPNMAGEGMRRIVRPHLTEVRACYSGRLKEKPDLTGTLIVAWNLGEKGEVTSVRAEQPFDYIVDNCVMNKLKTWKFPVPPKDKKVSVSYPFFFAPR